LIVAFARSKMLSPIDRRGNRTQEVNGSIPRSGISSTIHETRDSRFNSSFQPSATMICRNVVAS